MGIKQSMRMKSREQLNEDKKSAGMTIRGMQGRSFEGGKSVEEVMHQSLRRKIGDD